jgi:hypothetical protein
MRKECHRTGFENQLVCKVLSLSRLRSQPFRIKSGVSMFDPPKHLVRRSRGFEFLLRQQQALGIRGHVCLTTQSQLIPLLYSRAFFVTSSMPTNDQTISFNTYFQRLLHEAGTAFTKS